MPEAKSARGKLRQVERWLWQEYTPPLPVRVVVRRRVGRNGDLFATTIRRGDRLWISIWSGLLVWPSVAIRFLHHEAAHALAWQVHRESDHTQSDHPDEWGLWIARIERMFYDEGGSDDADELSPAPWS